MPNRWQNWSEFANLPRCISDLYQGIDCFSPQLDLISIHKAPQVLLQAVNSQRHTERTDPCNKDEAAWRVRKNIALQA